MNKRPRMAKKFYSVVALSMLAGMVLDYLGINAMKMLFWAAVLNGLLAAPLIVIILLVCNNAHIMGKRVNGHWLNAFGIFAALLMGVAAVATLITLI